MLFSVRQCLADGALICSEESPPTTKRPLTEVRRGNLWQRLRNEPLTNKMKFAKQRASVAI
jgi:hypothetical protein